MDTIKSGSDISRLFSCGQRIHTPYMTFIVDAREKEELIQEGKKQHDHSGRVAFIAGKKLGNAVWRNGAKRRMRELCKDLGGPWSGYDVIFLAKSGLVKATYSKVLSVCRKELNRTGLK